MSVPWDNRMFSGNCFYDTVSVYVTVAYLVLINFGTNVVFLVVVVVVL